MKPIIEKINSYKDPERGVIFQPNSRVHWYDYDNHMIIREGGFGIVIEMKKVCYQPASGQKPTPTIIVSVLCDNGKLKEFSASDLDLEDPWE